MNCSPKKYKISPEAGALLAASAWIVLISCLHLFITAQGNPGKKIRVGFLPITCHLLLPVAMERNKWFAKRVETVKFTSWPDMIESIKGKELDAAFILAPIALSLMSQDVPVDIALLGHRNGTCLVTSKKEDIKTARELLGKTVAIPIRFSTQNLALQQFLRKNGVDPKYLNLVELPPPDMPSALASGAIDAYIVGEPYAAQAEIAGAGKILHRIQDLWPNFISSVLIVRNDALEEHKKELNQIISILYSQGEWIENHRDSAAQIGAAFFGLPDELLLRVLEASPRRVSYRALTPKLRELNEIGGLMVKYGLLKQRPPCRIYKKWH